MNEFQIELKLKKEGATYEFLYIPGSKQTKTNKKKRVFYRNRYPDSTLRSKSMYRNPPPRNHEREKNICMNANAFYKP